METNKVVSPYLRVFEPPDEVDSITEFEYIEYLPNDSSNMNKDGYHQIETRDLDVYCVVLSDRFITLEAVSGRMNVIV